MPDEFAQRLEALNVETGLEVMARAKKLEAAGRDIIHLEIGEPDFGTPENIAQAGIRAIQEGHTHYVPSAGIAGVRQAVAAFVEKESGHSVGADQVVITPGAKSIIFFVMMALLNDGDEVIVPDPGYPNYSLTASFLGGKVVPLALDAENGFDIDVDRLATIVTPRTKLLVLNSPQNPTGAIVSRESLQGIVELANKHGFYVLSDEIYSKMVYDGGFTSLFEIDGAMERGVLLDGHSKAYAMTGWRLGYGVMPADLAVVVARVLSNVNSCTAGFTQLAGVEALQGPQDSIAAMMKEFHARRDLVVDGLNAVDGLDCRVPQGAFYAFPSIKDTGMTSRAASDGLLNDAGVAVLSGAAFGDNGEGHIRISYATSTENLQAAIERIAAFFAAS